MKIVGICGSLRKGSFNLALLEAAAERAKAPLEIDAQRINGIPLYDADVESEKGLPDSVVQLKARIEKADGLLLVTPEYNQSIPGVFKNAIDWLSRPASDIGKVFGGKPVGLIGASPGRMGTISSQTAWLQVFRGLSLVPFLGKTLYVSRAHEVFKDGSLGDDTVAKLLDEYLEAYGAFVGRLAQR